MELNELKNAWSAYDKKLTENLRINEKLLKRMNLDRSKNEFYKPMYMEIVNLVVLFLVFFPMLYYFLFMNHDSLFRVLALLCAMIALSGMALSIIKIRMFTKIDFYHMPVVGLQQQITSLKMRILKYRKIEFALTVPFILLIFTVLFKWIHHVDLFHYDHLLDPVIRLTIIFAVGIPAALWINKHFYDKKIDNARYYLHEIEDFLKEE